MKPFLWVCCVLLATSTVANTQPLQQVLLDADRYWFGTSYKMSCPGGPNSSLVCETPDTARKSILARLLGINDQDKLNDIASRISPVTIVYNSPSGNYTGCGQSYTVPALRNLVVDPTAVTRESLFSLRYKPSVTWRARSRDTLHTVIIWDPGNYFNHGLYINVPGGSLDYREVVRSYLGPLNSFLRENTYVFAVYEQTGRIDLSAAKMFIDEQLVIVPSEFVARFIGPYNRYPAHAGVLNVLADPFSVQTFFDRFFFNNNCPYLISQLDIFQTTVRFLNLSVPFSNPATTASVDRNTPYATSLRVVMDITYTAEDLSIQSCCTNYTFTRGQYIVNPFTNKTVRPSLVRDTPVVRLTPIDVREFRGIAGDAYTLIMIDVDPAVDNETSSPFYLHWLVTNIRFADYDTGNDVLRYIGPNPPEPNDPRPYMFLLYKQPVPTVDNSIYFRFCTPEQLRPAEIGKFFDPFFCYAWAAGLQQFMSFCAVSLPELLAAFNLKELVGVTWFLSEQDAFARFRAPSLFDFTLDEACQGQPGYASQCPPPCPDTNPPGKYYKY